MTSERRLLDVMRGIWLTRRDRHFDYPLLRCMKLLNPRGLPFPELPQDATPSQVEAHEDALRRRKMDEENLFAVFDSFMRGRGSNVDAIKGEYTRVFCTRVLASSTPAYDDYWYRNPAGDVVTRMPYLSGFAETLAK